MKKPLGAVALLLSMTCLAHGQAQMSRGPKPGPEVQKWGYYVGSWKGHGQTKAGPFGAAGKLSSKMDCDWFAGGFQVVCRGKETGPTGTREFLNILGYDEKTKTYTQYSVSSLGDSEYDPGGTLAGDTLTYLVDADAGGKTVKFRYTEVHALPGRFTYKAEASVGGAWKAIADGEIVKVK